MLPEKICNQVINVSYKSCIFDYQLNNDIESIVNEFYKAIDDDQFCKAKGVLKALELIDIINHIKDAKKDSK